jgi:hypothetical protein
MMHDFDTIINEMSQVPQGILNLQSGLATMTGPDIVYKLADEKYRGEAKRFADHLANRSPCGLIAPDGSGRSRCISLGRARL